MRFGISAFVLTMSLFWLSAVLVHAEQIEVLDQEFVEDQSAHPGHRSIYGIPETHEVAQTFTVGIEGILSRVELLLHPRSATAVVSLRDTSGSLPGGLLASVTRTVSTGSETDVWESFDFGSSEVHVKAGDVLAVCLTVESGHNVEWCASLWDNPASLYDGGRWFNRGDLTGWEWQSRYPRNDMEFRTFVLIPEPSTLILLTMGAVGLLAYAWRRRKAA
ncbi:MAG: PEP-CTERM sorting domain-containing protein [Candidatus Nealsonbacteria bacterium]|nr:PEP-CTERM sorting domain-containing protein [Candidatus Nealsonbacteria bacterium]